MGRTGHGFETSLPAIRQRLVPHLTQERMVGEPLNLFDQPLTVKSLEGLHNAAVQLAPPFLQQTSIRHLVGEGMFEGVLQLGEEACLIEELGRLEVCKAPPQLRLGPFSDGLEEGKGDIRPDDRRGLEEAFLVRWRPMASCMRNAA